MKVAYMRISASDQNADDQRKALRRAGAQKIYEEQAQGGRWDRPELQKMINQLKSKDEVIVLKLDHLSRSLLDLLRVLSLIQEKEAAFRSIAEKIETKSSAGKMMMKMLSAFAEFEREMIRERTRVGLEAARARGRVGGRRPKLNALQQDTAFGLVQEGKSQAEVARLFGVSRSVICRMVKAKSAKLESKS